LAEAVKVSTDPVGDRPDGARLRAVPHTTVSVDALPFTEIGLGRAAFIGGIVGVFVVFLACGAIMLSQGASLGAAATVASVTTVWGGPGFGAMMGAVIHYCRREAREAAMR
jgi:hypothetical protein